MTQSQMPTPTRSGWRDAARRRLHVTAKPAAASAVQRHPLPPAERLLTAYVARMLVVDRPMWQAASDAGLSPVEAASACQTLVDCGLLTPGSTVNGASLLGLVTLDALGLGELVPQDVADDPPPTSAALTTDLDGEGEASPLPLEDGADDEEEAR